MFALTFSTVVSDDGAATTSAASQDDSAFKLVTGHALLDGVFQDRFERKESLSCLTTPETKKAHADMGFSRPGGLNRGGGRCWT